MASRSLTAANAVIMLSVDQVYPTPFQLQGFAADDVFDVPNVEQVEAQMGIDGKLSAGWVAVAVKWGFTLQANSPICDNFETWSSRQNRDQQIYFAGGLVTLSAVGRKYTMTNGVLSSYSPAPAAGKILRPRKFEITWESVQPAAA